MYIIHSLKEDIWNTYKNKRYYGELSINKCGFIHCSEVSTYKWVAPNFANDTDNYVILVIDTDRLENKVVWEDLGNFGVEYPHIYGLLNRDAVVEVLPHLWSEDKEWIVNDELEKYK